MSASTPGRVGDGEPRGVFAHKGGCLLVAGAREFPQIPDLDGAIQGGGGEEVWVQRVQREPADFVLGEDPLVRLLRRFADVGAAHDAFEGRKVDNVGIGAGHVQRRDGRILRHVGWRVDLDRDALCDVESSDGGVVGGRVDGVGVGGGEEEGGDGARVGVEGGHLGFLVFVFRGVLGGIEDAHCAFFVAGEDDGFVLGGVEAHAVDSLGYQLDI